MKYFTDRSKAVLLLWIFYVFVLSVFVMSLCGSVYMCFVVTCWERADLLALVCGVYCEFVTFPLVSWVRCGTWLYRFLIFAPFLTFTIWPTSGLWPFCKQFSPLVAKDIECSSNSSALNLCKWNFHVLWSSWKYIHLFGIFWIGPSINGLVTNGNTKLCCRGFALVLFQSVTAYKIDSEQYLRLYAKLKYYQLQ